MPAQPISIDRSVRAPLQGTYTGAPEAPAIAAKFVGSGRR